MGKLILIVLLFLTSNFLNVSITEGFFIEGIQDVFGNKNFSEILGKNMTNYKLNFSDYINYFTKSEEEAGNDMLGKIIGESIKKEEKTNGFIKSNKSQILKNGNFEIKSPLKFSDGIKNGFGVVFLGTANVFKGFINLATGKESKKSDYLIYTMKSFFTQALTFFFVSGNFYYYISYISSIICSWLLLTVLITT